MISAWLAGWWWCGCPVGLPMYTNLLNKKEIQSICEELVFLDKNLQQPLIDHCFQHPHDTLMGDATTGKFYHGFNEIIIPH